MRLLLVVATILMSGCGGNSPTAPESPALPPEVNSFPSWRMDRSDVLNWMVGHTPEGQVMWADNFPTGGGGHGHGSVLEGSQGSGSFVWVKLTPNNYERFSYDANFIYWREDHDTRGMNQQGGVPWGSIAYTWTNVRWLPRRLPPPGTVMNNTENRIQWRDRSCAITVDNNYPVYVTFHGMERLPQGEAIHTSFRVGGSPFSEHQWYTWENGWVRWEYHRDGEGQPRYVSNFTTLLPRPTDYDYPCSGGLG